MSFLKKFVRGAIDVVTTPIDVAKDITTLGGKLTNEDTPYTIKKIKRIAKDCEEIYESLDE